MRASTRTTERVARCCAQAESRVPDSPEVMLEVRTRSPSAVASVRPAPVSEARTVLSAAAVASVRSGRATRLT
ncbi:hypothetical protein [Cellulomonas sp. P24]|uniref:hypothetical protein n=1 Tax=Cellulomonas sp. P24 TaxID=2885206 RepID=UPI00216AF780|nr:hypothetical protein [Cellulomonas sp. P24]MCR6493634.1 hypothetical protein [Cellulomonas sp. P24]